MALRKAAAYTKKKARPFTRKSKVKSKSYIKTIPNSLVIKFRMGDLPGYRDGKYKIVLIAKSHEKVQIRDHALEAMRQFLNRFLTEKFKKEFYFEVKPYPHNILRENKMLTGAGADRMQTGMSLSFGKSIGRAAFVKPGQEIFRIAVITPKQESEARQLIKSIKSRIPCKLYVETERK